MLDIDPLVSNWTNSQDAPLYQDILNRAEAAIRTHDPCLSCSTHAMGQMPIRMELIAPDGKVLDTLQRD